ncbi:MAG TPA: hypothetical protein VMI35_14860, partial [Puia sp.]|nr:hypothetical protein [Puia sp.]
YPEHSATAVCWKFIFQLSIWGSIRCKRNNFLFNKIRRYYHQKGNHISKAGWPVITDFSGDYFSSPVYGLGASLIKKEWLRQTPFDEVLDSHGIGDNYGAAMGFPGNISILNQAWVYHHRDNSNRLDQPLQYFRRALALGYFIQTKERLRNARVPWLLWSLTGSLVRFMLTGDLGMTKAAMVSIIRIACRRNPYVLAARDRTKITEPKL